MAVPLQKGDDVSEGRSVRDLGIERILAGATLTPYEVYQSPSGKAGVYDKTTATASGDYADLTTIGTFTIAKTTGIVLLKGGRVYWDHSANTCTYRKVSDRDFYIGRAAEDATSAAVSVPVLLNEDPPYDIDLARDGFISALAGTAAAGGFGYPVNLGGSLIFELTATSEAQKVDALSVDGFALGANAIIEGAFRVNSDGAGTVVDVSMGVANGTHATDADSITDVVLLHLDANNTNILAQSRDGTTTVAATDTTTDYTEGTALSTRKEFWIDMRDPADVQIYVDGVNVLPATTFNVNASVATWFLLVHVEKTSSTDTYKLAVDWLRARFSEQ